MWLHRRNKIRQVILSLSPSISLSFSLTSHFLFSQPGKQKKKFSSFFKSLVIELDKELYGPDNHLVEVWHHFKNIWCELLESCSDPAFFCSCAPAPHVYPFSSEWTFNLLSELSFSGTECPPLRRQMVSRWKGPVTWMWNALFCSCWITRYLCVLCDHCHQPGDLHAFSASVPLTDWLLFVPSLHSTNWTPVWPVCWVCTHRHVPVSCRRSGFTLKTTSCRTVMRKSTSTATATFGRLAIHRLFLLIILMPAECTSMIGSFNKWTVLFSFMILLRNRHKLASDSSSNLLFRSLAVHAWDLLKFPWSWQACCSIPTP